MRRLATIVTLAILGLALMAQSGLKTNSIIGEVHNEAGTALPQVNVDLYRGNQLVANTQTDAQGRYRFDNMQQGQYKLVFSLAGYQSLTRVNIQLLEGAPEVVDVVLKASTSLPVAPDTSTTVTEHREMELGQIAPGVVSGSMRDMISLQGGIANAYLPYDEGFIEHNTEEYAAITPNIYHSPLTEPLSTFSIDVDTAGYSMMRRMINNGQLPQGNAVRIEEMINYFDYDYPEPTGDHPFSIYTELGECPWNPSHQLVHIGLKGKSLDMEDAPPSNLVFLLDVSGSMMPANKLPLVQRAMKLVVDNMREEDSIGIVTYASGTRIVLPATSGDQKEAIKEAIDRLSAGGSTAGAAGIQLAYQVAQQGFKEEGNNRIILCTDGDFNVGVSSTASLEELITQKRDQGIFLTVLGFGMGNYKDNRMETLADKGNGNYAYIDTILEAQKVLVNELSSTLYTIAKDVKIQAEFNPAHVRGYRLIGYENRMLRAEDFRDDTKDAGELGAGHTVTALYEIIPSSSTEAVAELDSLRYQSIQISDEAKNSPEMMTVKLRYKLPDGDTSIPLESPLLNMPLRLAQSSNRFRFAAAVAGYGMLLQDSDFKANLSWETVKSLATGAIGEDKFGYRQEFISLIDKAALLSTHE